MSPTEPGRCAKSLIGIVYCALLLPCAYADDWPQWQGPNRNAVSKGTGLLKQWPKDGPPLAWAHPVIANGKLYIRDQDLLFCYNVKAQGQ